MLTETNCCGTLFLVQEITVITVITSEDFKKKLNYLLSLQLQRIISNFSVFLNISNAKSYVHQEVNGYRTRGESEESM